MPCNGADGMVVELSRGRRLLQRIFGYDDFRGQQFQAIQAVSEGRDVVVNFPTGRGKSLVYQLGSLLRAEPGVSLCVEPLLALMENQVNGLRARGVATAALNSTCKAHERQAILDDLKSKAPKLRLVYVTPEMVSTEGFRTIAWMLAERDLLRLIAIDEAHCADEWGHSFRPDFLKLNWFKVERPDSKLARVPMVALTATATERTRNEIISVLGLRNPKIFAESVDRCVLVLSDPCRRPHHPRLFFALHGSSC